MFGKYLVAAALLSTAINANAVDLSLEPCINGEVSASGNFPNQSMEDQVYAYLNWRSYEPYYLFAVAANYIITPFDEGKDPAETR